MFIVLFILSKRLNLMWFFFLVEMLFILQSQTSALKLKKGYRETNKSSRKK